MTRLAALLLLCASIQDKDEKKDDRIREYVIDTLVRGLLDRPSAPIGALYGAPDEGLGEAYSQAMDEDTLGEYLAAVCTPDAWGEENTIGFAGGKLVVTAPAESHKAIAAALSALRARLAPDIAVDAVILEITPAALNDVLGGGGAPSVLSDERTLKLHQLVKEAVEIRAVRRLRLNARNGQRLHEASIETTTYLADADVNTDTEPPSWRAMTSPLKTGVTFDIRPTIVEGGIFIGCSWQDARLEKMEPFDAGGRTLQMPRVRRLSAQASLLVPNTGTAFAGAVTLPDKPGWMLATFVRPQIDPKLPKVDAEPALIDLHAFSRIEEETLSNDEFAALLMRSVETDSWDEDQGRFIEPLENLLLIRNSADIVRACRGWVADRARSTFRPVAIEARLIKTAAIIQAEPLTARDIEKLLAKGTVLWQGVASGAQRHPLLLEDVVRRPVVTDYVDKDPSIGTAQWGVTFAAKASYDPTGGAIHVEDLDVQWSTATEPMPTAPHPGLKDAVIHTPKFASHIFKGNPTLTPGDWTVQNIAAVGEESVVLLVRATVQK